MLSSGGGGKVAGGVESLPSNGEKTGKTGAIEHGGESRSAKKHDQKKKKLAKGPSQDKPKSIEEILDSLQQPPSDAFKAKLKLKIDSNIADVKVGKSDSKEERDTRKQQDQEREKVRETLERDKDEIDADRTKHSLNLPLPMNPNFKLLDILEEFKLTDTAHEGDEESNENKDELSVAEGSAGPNIGEDSEISPIDYPQPSTSLSHRSHSPVPASTKSPIRTTTSSSSSSKSHTIAPNSSKTPMHECITGHSVLDKPYQYIKLKCFRQFWKSRLQLGTIRMSLFIVELQKTILSDDTLPGELKALFAKSVAGNTSFSGNDYNIFHRFQLAVDILRSGSISPLTVDRATRYLPGSISLANAVLVLALQSKRSVLPRSVDIEEAWIDRKDSLFSKTQNDIMNFILQQDLHENIDDASGDDSSNSGIDEDNKIRKQDAPPISWLLICGPKNLGKTSRLLSACFDVIQCKNAMEAIQERLVSTSYDSRTFEDICNLHNDYKGRDVEKLKKKGTQESNGEHFSEVVYLDLRGVISKSTFVSVVARQLGIIETTFGDLERVTEQFFIGLSRGSLVILDHVTFPYCAIVIKEYFEMLLKYPSYDVLSLLSKEESAVPFSLSSVTSTSLVSAHLSLNIVVVSREVENIESMFSAPWEEKAGISTVENLSEMFDENSLIPPQCRVKSFFIPLCTEEESKNIASRCIASRDAMGEFTVESLSKVFGGLPGNIVEVASLGDVGARTTKKYFESEASPLDYETCLAEIKMKTCISGDSTLANDCYMLMMALSPLHFVSLTVQMYMLDGKQSNALFYDTDYIHGSFSYALVWELCKHIFTDLKDKDEISIDDDLYMEIPSRFSAAWSHLISCGWVKSVENSCSIYHSHQHNPYHDHSEKYMIHDIAYPTTKMYILAHPSFIVVKDLYSEIGFHLENISTVTFSGNNYSGEGRSFVEQFEKYLSIQSIFVADLNNQLARFRHTSSLDISSTSMVLENANLNAFKLQVLSFMYDAFKNHLDILFYFFTSKCGSTFLNVLENAQDSVEEVRIIEDSSHLTWIEQYHQFSTVQILPDPLHIRCGIFPRKLIEENSSPRKYAVLHNNESPINKMLSKINIKSLVHHFAGCLENICKYRLTPVYAVLLCKTSLESCTPQVKLQSLEHSKLGMKLKQNFRRGKNHDGKDVIERKIDDDENKDNGAVELSPLRYAQVLLDLGSLLVERNKFSKAKELLRLSVDIAQELEEIGYQCSNQQESQSSEVLLVKCLLRYARCIELAARFGIEKHSLDFKNIARADFDEEEVTLGIWIDTLVINDGDDTTKPSPFRAKRKKYYADGDSLRTANYGHSRATMEKAYEMERSKMINERSKAKPLYEQAVFALEVLSQTSDDNHLSQEAAVIYVQLLSRLGELERYIGNYSKAKQYIEDTIRWRKKYFGNYHALVAEGFQQLGYLLQVMQKPEAAIQVYALALSIYSSIYKKSDTSLVACISAVASCLRALGREEDSKIYLQEALHLMSFVYHIFDIPILATFMRYACTCTSYEPKSFSLPGDGSVTSIFGSHNFAVSLRPCDLIGAEYFIGERQSNTVDLMNFKCNIELIDKLVKMIQFNFISGKSRYVYGVVIEGIFNVNKVADVGNRRKFIEKNELIRLSNIYIAQASLYSLVARYDDALKVLNRCLKIFKYSEADNGDPDTRVADIYLAMGEIDRRAALANIAGIHLSHTQIVTRFESSDFGNKFREMDRQRRMKGSLDAFKVALSIYEGIYDREHPIVLAIKKCLGNTYRDLGAFKTARRIFEDVLEVYRIIRVGPTVEFADSLFAFAVMLRAHDEFDESITILEQCTLLYRRLFGERSLMATVSSFVLASSHYESNSSSGDFASEDESIKYIQKLLDDCLENFRHLIKSQPNFIGKGKIIEPPVIGDILNMIGSLKQRQSRFEVAKTAYGEALDVFIVLYGDEHPSVARTMNNLAVLLDDSGSPSDASEMYECSISMLNRYYSHAPHPLLLVTMENYAAMLEANGNIVDADSLNMQADEIRSSLHELDKDLPEMDVELARLKDWNQVFSFFREVFVSTTNRRGGVFCSLL